MKELQEKYKSNFRNKLKWYKQDQNNPLLKCIIDDFDSTISDVFQELENRSCGNCDDFDNEMDCDDFGFCTNNENNKDFKGYDWVRTKSSFCCNKWKNKD